MIPVGQLLGYGLAPFIMKVLPPPGLTWPQVMSKKAQYILATTSMAASLGGLALSYQAKVTSTSSCSHLPQETGFEPSAVAQTGFMVSSLGLTCGYGLGDKLNTF